MTRLEQLRGTHGRELLGFCLSKMVFGYLYLEPVSTLIYSKNLYEISRLKEIMGCVRFSSLKPYTLVQDYIMLIDINDKVGRTYENLF
jgi:hypothetical protein